MSLFLRRSVNADLPFMRQMLYEAVYWKSISKGTNPPFEKGLSEPGVGNALESWNVREGDLAVVAEKDSIPVGAAWYRFYNSENEIPVLVAAVHRDHRRAGIGEKLINRLIHEASQQKVGKISLMVSKDNHAKSLYEKCGFKRYGDIEESVLMTRKV